MKKGTTLIRLCNFALVVVMLAMLVCQFLPFWTVGEEQVSMQEYTWITWDHGALTKQLQKEVNPDFMVKDFVMVSFFMLVGCVLGIIFCLIKRNSAAIALIPFCLGILGIWGYLTKPVLQIGFLWQLHLGVSIALAVVALVPLSVCVIKMIDWFKVPKTA